MAADRSVVEALGQTDLFSSLDKRALQQVAAQAKVVDHAAGKEVTEQGGTGVGFHLILSGTAAVTVNGLERPDLGPGQYFGEISLIDGLPRSATVTAKEALKTVSLVSWTFTPLLEEEQGLAKALLVVMCARLRAAEAS
jgi:CRP/FNR family transcriptional regulator, cyclic AMP receptor protein